MTSVPQVPSAEPPGAELLDDDGYALCVAFSPGGESLATAGSPYLTVRRWPSLSIRWRTKVEGWLSSVDALAFSPDGQRLAAAHEGTLQVWGVASGAPQLLIDHEGPVNDVAFHPDGTRLATACGDGSARVWTAEGESVLVVTHRKWLNAVGFTPDGSRLLTASDDNTVRVWDLITAEPVLRLRHDGPTVTVAASPDGRCLLTGSADRTARLWDAGSGEELLRLPHRRGLRAAVYDADGRHIATVAAEGTVRIWDAASGDLRAELHHRERPQDAAFSPDGSRLATVAFATRIWQLPPLDEPGTVRLDSEGVAAVRVRRGLHGSSREGFGPVLGDGGPADSGAGVRQGELTRDQRHTTDARFVEPAFVLEDDEPTPWSWLVIGAAMLLTIGWLVFGSDAAIGDRLWGIGGAVSVAVGLALGMEMRDFGAGSPRYRAEVSELQRLDEHEGFRATVAVTLADGTRLVLPLKAEHKRPRTGGMVALTNDDNCLSADDDPHQADGAVLMHPLEIYGWPALFVGFGALGLAIALIPG